jgi:prolyl-tRNA synthetase
MGSYGIGLGRCVSAIVEQHNDEKGIIWPYSLAPYKVCIVPATNNESQISLAESIYNELTSKGIDTLLDDRDERLGVKLNDMDLIGIPVRILVGKRSSENIIEFKMRNNEVVEEITVEDAINKIISL